MDAEVKMLTPIKAIRAKCLDCTCGSPQEVRLCPTPDCPLYPYRMGHNPNRKGKGGKFPTQQSKTETYDTEQSGIPLWMMTDFLELKRRKTDE